MKDLLMVGIGGFMGSVLRYKVGVLIATKNTSAFPWGTFTVNLVGAFLIGLLISSALKSQQTTTLLLVTGFCGGFTTFSTFALENLKLLQSGQWLIFLSYALFSLIGGIVLCYGGYFMGSKTF